MKIKKIIEFLDTEKKLIEDSIDKRAEIYHNGSLEYFYLNNDDIKSTFEKVFPKKELYHVCAYYVNLLNSLKEGNIGGRKQSAFYRRGFGNEYLKNTKFVLQDSFSITGKPKLEIVNQPKSKIVSIINKLMWEEKRLSVFPKDVFEAIKNNDEKLKGDSLMKFYFVDNILKKEKGLDNNLYKKAEYLLKMELMEDAMLYVGQFLQSQSQTDKYKFMDMWSSLISSNPMFFNAFLNIVVNHSTDIATELVGSFLLSLNEYNIPMFEIIKEEHHQKFAKFLVEKIPEVEKILTKEEKFQLNAGLALSFSTNIGALSFNKILSDDAYQKLFERVNGFYHSNEYSEFVIQNNPEKSKKKSLNNQLAKKLIEFEKKFSNTYSISPIQVAEYVENVPLDERGFKVDVSNNISTIVEEVYSNIKAESKSRNISSLFSLKQIFKEIGFEENATNNILFDKVGEFFIKNAISQIYPDIKVKARSTFIQDKNIDDFFEEMKENHYKKITLPENFLNGYRNNNNAIDIIIPFKYLADVDSIEETISALIKTFDILLKKSIKDAFEEVDYQKDSKILANTESEIILNLTLQNIWSLSTKDIGNTIAIADRQKQLMKKMEKMNVKLGKMNTSKSKQKI